MLLRRVCMVCACVCVRWLGFLQRVCGCLGFFVCICIYLQFGLTVASERSRQLVVKLCGVIKALVLLLPPTKSLLKSRSNCRGPPCRGEKSVVFVTLFLVILRVHLL